MEQKITWLEFQSQKTGKSVEEVRAEMSRRSKLADRSKSGFASMTPERLSEVSNKGYQAGIAKNPKPRKGVIYYVKKKSTKK